VREGAEVGAEAEALNADWKGSAAAMEEMFEERFEAKRALDVVLHLRDLAMSEFPPARADGSVFPQAGEEELDFTETEAHAPGEANEEGTMEGIAGIAALAADAVGGGEKPELFIVTEGRSVKAGAAGEFSDFHL